MAFDFYTQKQPCEPMDTLKPILVIYLPSRIDQGQVGYISKHFKESPISEQYHILGVHSNAREEVEIQALFPKDFDAVGLEELKQQMKDQVAFLIAK